MVLECYDQDTVLALTTFTRMTPIDLQTTFLWEVLEAAASRSPHLDRGKRTPGWIDTLILFLRIVVIGLTHDMNPIGRQGLPQRSMAEEERRQPGEAGCIRRWRQWGCRHFSF